MGEITRIWPFRSHGSRPAFELTIREPPLTGDHLGLKTWGSSYVLAQLLPRFAATSFSHLFPLGRTEPSVLELGSGTGLLGMSAACAWAASVVLTDLPAIVPNLAHNADRNRDTVESLGGDVSAAPLTWGGSTEESDARFQDRHRFKLVLAADPLYDDEHPGLLAGTIHSQLALDRDGRALVMIPKRDGTTHRLMSSFREAMSSQPSPLLCVEEGVMPGRDDWGEDDDEPQSIDCWWGVFRRRQCVGFL
ncbi:hypothetical protein VTK73DRAFT_6977 [Phialemonium thermophilum]|uniref:Uncharacterized protein n=1 Tax=Phialemonium thermophilum TaxID=223376 RepID=A0ABR3WH69_9PEZI